MLTLPQVDWHSILRTLAQLLAIIAAIVRIRQQLRDEE
jgi:hypothetical protein